jgi:Flp pilus assembly pilin Flp
MLRRADRDQRGVTSSDYAGILAVVALVFLALFALNLDDRVAPAIDDAVCTILGGERCGEPPVAQVPEKCLVGKSTTSANANVLIAFVQIDKDSILIREDYSDGSSKFTIVDNTEAAGELFAGAKAKVGKLGADLSAEALAGVGLAGGRIFEFSDQEDADAFQESVQAAGGFDGILRDLASYNDEIPIVGWDNPLGGIDDWALDQLGVDDDEDLPEPKETYVEGKAFLNGAADAAGGIGVIDAEIKGLIEGAGIVRVVSSGQNAGDVTFSVRLDGDASGGLTVGALGGGVNGRLMFTAQITLDAQNDYRPDKLVLKGNAGYTGSINAQAVLEGDDLKDLASELEKVTLSSSAGDGQGLEVSGELDLKDPENLDATLRALTSQGRDVLPLVNALDENGKLGFDTYDLETSETTGEVKVGVGIGGGAGGSSTSETQSDRTGLVRMPGGSFEPRLCTQPSS